MGEPRYQHGVTRLLNGDVLVEGGRSPSLAPAEVGIRTAEVYNPASGTWNRTGSMSQARFYHSATLMMDNRVLVAGGINLVDSVLTSAEVFDPSTGTWTTTGAMSGARREHTAILLRDGTVLVAGGQDGNPMDSAEVYDPVSRRWDPVGRLRIARQSASATLLPDGRVLVTGGSGIEGLNDLLGSTELYDPRYKRWAAAGSMKHPRNYLTVTNLDQHHVLAIGGRNRNGAVSAIEVFDIRKGTWRVVGHLSVPRWDHRTVSLPSGELLVLGGVGSDDGVLRSTELVDPRSFKTRPGPEMIAPRYGASATLTADGTVIVTGGASVLSDGGSFRSTTEVMTPPAGGRSLPRPPTISSVKRLENALWVVGNGFTDYLQRSGGGFQADALLAPTVSARCMASGTLLPTGLTGTQFWSASEIRIGMSDACPTESVVVTIHNPAGGSVTAVVSAREIEP